MMDASTSPIVDEMAELARALGHAHRLLLLELVADGELAVERLGELSGLTVANTSQHLQHLKRAGFVQTRRDGKRVLYRFGDGPVEPLLAALRGLVAHNRAQIRALVADSISHPERLETITREELLRRLREDAVLLLDVRPQGEFEAGHLPGAVNIPVTELERRLAELPRDKPVVAYCRGVRCVLSADALAILRAHGWTARRFTTGFPDWEAAGFDIEGGNYESG